MSELTMGIKSKVDTSKRPQRTPLGQRNRLSFGKQDPNFSYRVINDQDDRIEQALAGGYEFVVSDDPLGDKRAAEAGKSDSRVSKPVGNGVRGYLMRIPKELYEEDQNAKMAKVDDMEKQLKPEKSSVKNAYGEGLTNT